VKINKKLSQVALFAILIILILIVLIPWIMLPVVSDAEAYSNCSRADLDRDGITEEYILDDDRLTVREEGQLLWQSPPDWHIENVVLGDANNDGVDNIVMTLWKTGSFGPVKPFWYPNEDVSYKNHLFVYQLKDKGMKQVWCSSDLDHPIVSFTIRDMDKDNLMELVVEEGQYQKLAGHRYTLDKSSQLRTTVWRWDEWGFSAVKL